MQHEKVILIGALAGGMIFFVMIVWFVGEGNIRQVPIFLKEHQEATITFRNIDGVTKIVGLKGNGETNPTLVMRTGDFAYILTVINQDSVPHMLYVDGLAVHTKLIQPGENDTITLYSKEEGTYNYYDQQKGRNPIGVIKAVKVGTLID